MGTIQATNLAEAGLDKAVASLNSSGGVYNGEGETIAGPGSYEVTITSKDAATNIIQSTGYIPNKTNPTSKRTVQIQVSKGQGVAFTYGLQVGDGGLAMSDNVTVNGSTYANGNISLGNNSKITGDAYVAGGSQPTADQQSDCSGSNCADYIFGKNVAGQNIQDVAQSFQPSANTIINKISLKLKKVGSPSNPTVRIMGDIIGNPNKNNVITSGVLNASLVSTSYGFVDVTFSTTPNLIANTPYWIMIHANSLDNSNYWVWSEDTLQGYNRGAPKWSTNWQVFSPTWTAIAGDLGFKTYMGGVITSIIGTDNAVIQGNAHAHLLQGLTINKDAYYQTIQTSTVKGTSYPNSTDPVPQPMPISDSNIQSWKDQATAAGVFAGNITTCQDLPSGKYVGSITLNNGCTFKVGSPIWFTGGITWQNTVNVRLNPSFGASSGVIITDGIIRIGDQVSVQGSGTPGSYLPLLSTFNSRDDLTHRDAIVTTDNLFNGVLYSNLGSIRVTNNGSLYQVTGWKVYLNDGITINYQTGLAGTFFSSGATGSYTPIKGTYQLK